jgi:uncharacterized iron-regulated membrane protein
MMTLRRWHTYVGIFIAPSVLFFAMTGIVQLFSLHEARDGYTPPPIIERLGRVHKDQVFSLGRHRPPPPAAARPAARPPPEKASGPKHDQPKVATYLLKWFFTIVALGLIASTGMGLYMSLA